MVVDWRQPTNGIHVPPTLMLADELSCQRNQPGAANLCGPSSICWTDPGMTIVSTVIIAWVAFNVGFTAGAVWHSKMRRHRKE